MNNRLSKATEHIANNPLTIQCHPEALEIATKKKFQ